MSDIVTSVKGLLDMPPELILRIAELGQRECMEESFDPFSETFPLHDLFLQPLPSKALDCVGNTGAVWKCLKENRRPVENSSFLQQMRLICRPINFCLTESSSIWGLENTLYADLMAHGRHVPALACTAVLGGSIPYKAAGILITEKVCH